MNNKQWRTESSAPKWYISARVEELKFTVFLQNFQHMATEARSGGVSRKEKKHLRCGSWGGDYINMHIYPPLLRALSIYIYIPGPLEPFRTVPSPARSFTDLPAFMSLAASVNWGGSFNNGIPGAPLKGSLVYSICYSLGLLKRGLG